MLHTLHTGEVQSKKAGVKLALRFVDPKSRELIGRVWRDREGVRFGIIIGQKAATELFDETFEFIIYAAAQIDIE